MTRPKIPADTQTRLLTLSRRRCAICFGLSADLSEKPGQIAHLDHNPENNAIDNLVWLCLEHHDRYDGKTRQSKGLQIDEVKTYRTALYDAVRRFLESMLRGTPGEDSSALLAQGELGFYIAEYRHDLARSTQALRDISGVLSRHNAQIAERMAKIQALLSSPRLNLRTAKSLDHLGGDQMTAFSNDLVAAGDTLAAASTSMLRALSRASAVASDFEPATREMFEDKLGQVKNIRALLETTMTSAAAARDQTAAYPRGSSRFNRGKRLAVAAIDENIGQLSRCAGEFQAAENVLGKILRLF